MKNFFVKIFHKKEITPEVLVALRGKFPDRLQVKIRESQDGGYWAEVENLPGCVTQANSGEELFGMVHDALYTYLDIPAEYIPYMPTFLPDEETRRKFGIEIPKEFLEKDLAFQKA